MTSAPEKTSSNPSKSTNKSRAVQSVAGSILWPLAIFFVAQILVALILSPLIPGFTDEEQATSITGTFIYSVAFQLVALALVALYLKKTKRGLDWLGIGKLKMNQLAPMIPAIGAYIVATVTAFVIIGILVPTVNLDQDQVVGFETASSSLEILLAFVALVIITPLTEEVLIRGFMFKGLNRVLGFGMAAFVSAAIFALLHGQLNVGIDTFILGLVLAWLVNKTGSLWPAIFLHMLKNLVAFSFLYLL